MTAPESPIRNISDTARWAAAFRAAESERRDALFVDPFAARLAGQRGVDAIAQMPTGNKHAWAWVTRTVLFDRFIEQQIQQGVDGVLNLAAGLDARPYRMNVPAGLRWYEVDMPELIAYKQEILGNEQPHCRLERIPMNLADPDGRRALYQRVAGAGASSRKVLVLTEGLLIYFAPEEVAALAQDLAAAPGMRCWVTDLASPGLLRILQKSIGTRLGAAGAPLKFGPANGPRFFEPFGWHASEVRGMLKAAAKLRRLPWLLRWATLFPDRPETAGNRPWSGVCLLARGAAE